MSGDAHVAREQREQQHRLLGGEQPVEQPEGLAPGRAARPRA